MVQKLSHWVDEILYNNYHQSFEVEKILHDKISEFQHIVLLETKSHGKVLMLDGIVQLTERDEYVYHEMLVHVPLLTHPKPKNILIIGGGDGGALRRVLMHNVSKVTVVDIDPEVIEVSKNYLTTVSGNSFTDPRVNVLNLDGAEYVKNSTEIYDVILTDRGDQTGPMNSLFEKEYYENCKKCLNPDGILVSLTGVPFMQQQELSECIKILKSIFKINTCYLVSVPTYVGGTLAITWYSKKISPTSIAIGTLKRRYKKLVTKYYNPQTHFAAFVLPNDVQALLGK
jgi:spermidine synthase